MSAKSVIAWYCTDGIWPDRLPLPNDGQWIDIDDGLWAGTTPYYAFGAASGTIMCVVEARDIYQMTTKQLRCCRARILRRCDLLALLPRPEMWAGLRSDASHALNTPIKHWDRGTCRDANLINDLARKGVGDIATVPAT